MWPNKYNQIYKMSMLPMFSGAWNVILRKDECQSELLQLLANGVNINSCDSTGRTALITSLHICPEAVMVRNVQLVILHGADVNYKVCEHVPPILIAVAQNYPRVVRIMLDAGVDFEGASVALNHAICNFFHSIIPMLKDHLQRLQTKTNLVKRLSRMLPREIVNECSNYVVAG